MITEKFSTEEKRQLKKMLHRYGAIKDCSDKTGIHRCTISRALKTGEASFIIAVKMRHYIDGFSTRLFVQAA